MCLSSINAQNSVLYSSCARTAANEVRNTGFGDVSKRKLTDLYTTLLLLAQRQTLFNSASAVRSTSSLREKQGRARMSIYNVNYKFTICACHLALFFHINRCEENFSRLVRGLRKVDHYSISPTENIITMTGTRWHTGAVALDQSCLHHP